MAGTLLKTCSKLAVGVGAVYVTVQQGVWNGSSDGLRALDKVCSSVLPAASDYAKELPSLDDASSYVVSKWNNGVQLVFRGVVAAPEFTGKLVKRFNPLSDDTGSMPVSAKEKD